MRNSDMGGLRNAQVLWMVLALLAMGCEPSGERSGRSAGSAASDTSGDMVLIPGGEFTMGSDTDGDHAPAHRVMLRAFYIGRYEVTNAEYFEFCQATGHRLPEFWGEDVRRSGPEYPSHPVTGISWRDATEYAEWRGMRLPTEAEWELAARAGIAGRHYPTVDTISPADANFGSSLDGPVDVGSYPENGFGVYDMAGNVFEWVADWYSADYYATGPVENPSGPETGKFRVIRGGSWHSGPYCLRVYYRSGLPPQWVDFGVGFRLAQDAAARQPG